MHVIYAISSSCYSKTSLHEIIVRLFTHAFETLLCLSLTLIGRKSSGRLCNVLGCKNVAMSSLDFEQLNLPCFASAFIYKYSNLTPSYRSEASFCCVHLVDGTLTSNEDCVVPISGPDPGSTPFAVGQAVYRHVPVYAQVSAAQRSQAEFLDSNSVYFVVRRLPGTTETRYFALSFPIVSL